MPEAPVEVVLCPPERRSEALSLVLSEIAPSQRAEIAGGLLGVGGSKATAAEALYVALRGSSTSLGQGSSKGLEQGGQLCGAAWGQRQPGNTAVFWPPQLVTGEDRHTAELLTEAVHRVLDASGIGMTQSLLPSADVGLAPLLTSAGYAHLADLLYLTCEAERFPMAPPASELQFVAYDDVQRERLTELVEQTYAGTLDCPALNGARRLEDVVEGYRATGSFRAENWLIAREGERDVGVLLLTDHPSARHWELMYMGLVPAVRGRALGLQITRHALWLARRAGVERIVLAVDAANRPALAMYERAGFAAWDRRSVFVRLCSAERLSWI